MKKLAVLFISVLFTSQIAHSMGGSLGKLQIQNSRELPVTDHPQFVIGLGYIEEAFADPLFTFIENFYAEGLRLAIPEVKIRLIRQAFVQDVREALANPSTVGLILISHTCRVRGKKPVILMHSSQRGFAEVLPLDILSAARPSLRHLAFFGCYGPFILENYDVRTRLQDLPGFHTFYYNEGQSLRGVRAVTDLLQKMAQDIQLTRQ